VDGGCVRIGDICGGFSHLLEDIRIMTFLTTIGAITIARILFIAVRQFCRDWGKGYDATKWGAY
jgi:hypothetical protein